MKHLRMPFTPDGALCGAAVGRDGSDPLVETTAECDCARCVDAWIGRREMERRELAWRVRRGR